MSEFKIEKGIEIPQTTKYPFPEMEVGDSFLFSKEYTSPLRNRITTSASAFVKNQKPNWKFSIRKDKEGGIRVWRTK